MADNNNLDLNVNVGANIDPAIKEIDKIVPYINKINQTTERGLKYRGFEQVRETKTLKFFQQWIRYAGELKIVLAKVNKETGNVSAEYITPKTKQIQTKFGQIDTKATANSPLNPKNTKKVAEETQKAVKPANKFLRTFQRIGFYRLARNVFRIIENGFKTGIQQLAQVDDGVNKTMSQLTSSFAKIRGSFTLMLMPLIETIVPAVNDISNMFADIAENISAANSLLKGSNEYNKINKDYAEEYDKAIKSATLSFDKFETLSGASTTPYEKGNLDDLTDEELQRVKSTAKSLETVKSVLSAIWDIIKEIGNAIKSIFASLSADELETIKQALINIVQVLGEFLTKLIKIVVKTVEWIDKNIGLENALKAIVGAILAIKLANIINQVMSLTSAVKGLALAILAFTAVDSMLSKLDTTGKTIMGTIIALVGIFAALKAVMTGQWWLAGIAAGVAVAGVKAAISGLAEGGVTKANLSVGAGGGGFGARGSTVVNTSDVSGKSASDGIKQSMVEALYESSDLFQQNQTPVVLEVDGAEIARSRRFKSELNRTNSGLNLV